MLHQYTTTISGYVLNRSLRFIIIIACFCWIKAYVLCWNRKIRKLYFAISNSSSGTTLTKSNIFIQTEISQKNSKHDQRIIKSHFTRSKNGCVNDSQSLHAYSPDKNSTKVRIGTTISAVHINIHYIVIDNRILWAPYFDFHTFCPSTLQLTSDSDLFQK